MPAFKKYIIISLLLCVIFAVSQDKSYAFFWRRRPNPQVARPKAAKQTKKPLLLRKKKPRVKAYKYIKWHDFNKDGKVDIKDRLLWLNTHKGNYPTTFVSNENKDIIEAMDLNNDGSVSTGEMKQFYEKYDLNGNGSLEDAEINAATD